MQQNIQQHTYSPIQQHIQQHLQTHIQIDNKKLKKFKVVHSEALEKIKTYLFKLKIDFHQQINQYLSFCILGLDDKDSDWQGQNFILFTNEEGKCGTDNCMSEMVAGEKFEDFWKDNETILNVVLNYQEQIFEIYDDQRKGYIKNCINQNAIKSKNVILGIEFYQEYDSKIDMTILDVQEDPYEIQMNQNHIQSK
ncbi:hypothetical protein PPERSA_02777 [Pseudocohnilembus persalinus]|uniref:Uncharacterized protein n=1 Tax=Pseudocohnilembus persalinus TaxID=266149 RepID=A0A0V0Q8X9_PSEPJ|nr:hypothetical protein PPERSA_02777 [Pseudocohnilembus persalinus]|eukprot:KRW98629.1 hypothetical protein PPERSA_02777 [Pseudocohnilembus persalinus]